MPQHGAKPLEAKPETNIEGAPSLNSGGLGADSGPGQINKDRRVQNLINGSCDICALSKTDFLYLLKAVKSGDISTEDAQKILTKLFKEGKIDLEDMREILTRKGKSCVGKSFEDLIKLIEKVDLLKLGEKILTSIAKSLGFLKGSKSDKDESSDRDEIPFFLAEALSKPIISGFQGVPSTSRSAGEASKLSTGNNTEWIDPLSEDPLSILAKAALAGAKKAGEEDAKNKGGTLLFKSDEEKRLLEYLKSRYGEDLVSKLNPQHQYGTLSVGSLVAELEQMKREAGGKAA